VDNATLTRFFMIHIAVPTLLLSLVCIHLLLLHSGGTARPLRMFGSLCRINFSVHYGSKDWLNVLLFGCTVIVLLRVPFILLDPDNFLIADAFLSPVHIQPE
jgi:quinol-cytochrome oxidoreductase complex cytochrome b subunit